MVLAEIGGFEPPINGVKVRCLTAWLYLNTHRMHHRRYRNDTAPGVKGILYIQRMTQPLYILVLASCIRKKAPAPARRMLF